MENEVLDYNAILLDCGVGKLSSQVVGNNISNLNNHYSATELVNIFNYLLVHIEDMDLLELIIKQTDSYRSLSTLTILLQLLQVKFKELKEEKAINLRVLCVKAIANYRDASTVSVLLDILNNKIEHYKVRLACADALGRIGDKYAVRPLINLVEDDEEKSIYLKESATFALGLLGDTSAIDPLIAILESKQGFIDKFTFLKEKIVEALGKLNTNNKKVIKALKHSLMDSSSIVRINAIEAIMNSGDDNSIEIIKPLLQDEDDDVKKNAMIALYNLIGRDVLDEIIALPIYSEYLKIEAQELINEYEVEDE